MARSGLGDGIKYTIDTGARHCSVEGQNDRLIPSGWVTSYMNLLAKPIMPPWLLIWLFMSIFITVDAAPLIASC